MNKITIIGRTTETPVLKQTPNGVAVTTFTVAVNRRFNREMTDFIPVTAWRGLAENCAKYVDKGQQVAVTGELQTRKYEDRDGNKRTAFEIAADDVEFLGKAGQRSELGDQITIDDEQLPWS